MWLFDQAFDFLSWYHSIDSINIWLRTLLESKTLCKWKLLLNFRTNLRTGSIDFRAMGLWVLYSNSVSNKNKFRNIDFLYSDEFVWSWKWILFFQIISSCCGELAEVMSLSLFCCKIANRSCLSVIEPIRCWVWFWSIVLLTSECNW